MSISKSSASYLAKLQWDEVRKIAFCGIFLRMYRILAAVYYTMPCIRISVTGFSLPCCVVHLISGANCDSTSSECYQQMLNHT